MDVAAFGIATKTIDNARQALSLCHDNKMEAAKKCLVEVKRNGALLVSKTSNAVERLKQYEDWLSAQFRLQAQEKDNLYSKIRDAESRISSSNSNIDYLNRCLQENRRSLDDAQQDKARAISRKEEAQDKLDGISSPLVLIPGYALFWGIRELIENNTREVGRANSRIGSCNRRQSELENEMSRARETISRERRLLHQLQSDVRTASSRCTEQERKLNQTRQSISIILKAQKLYKNLAEIGEEAVENTKKLETAVQLAIEIKEELESSSGTVSNYGEGWDCLDELLQGEVSQLALEYTCAECNDSFKGIPWLKNGRLLCEQCDSK